MKLPIYILIALLASSCGKIRKNLTVDKTKTEIVSDQEIQEEITTTEKVDTLVVIPADTSEWIIPLRELTDSSTLIVESDNQKITFKFDPEKKTVRTTAVIKQSKVPVQIEKITVEKRNVESNYRVKTKAFDKDRQVEKTKPLIPWWAWIIIIIAGIVYVYLKFMPMNIFRS